MTPNEQKALEIAKEIALTWSQGKEIRLKHTGEVLTDLISKALLPLMNRIDKLENGSCQTHGYGKIAPNACEVCWNKKIDALQATIAKKDLEIANHKLAYNMLSEDTTLKINNCEKSHHKVYIYNDADWQKRASELQSTIVKKDEEIERMNTIIYLTDTPEWKSATFQKIKGLESELTKYQTMLGRCEDEKEELEKEIEHLKNSTHCAYCKFEVPLDTDSKIISEHIRTCENHPLRELERLVDANKTIIALLKEDLRAMIYTHGEPCPESPCNSLKRAASTLLKLEGKE